MTKVFKKRLLIFISYCSLESLPSGTKKVLDEISRFNRVIFIHWFFMYLFNNLAECLKPPVSTKEVKVGNIEVFNLFSLIPFSRFKTIHRLNEKLAIWRLNKILKSNKEPKIVWFSDPRSYKLIDQLGETISIFDTSYISRLLYPINDLGISNLVEGLHAVNASPIFYDDSFGRKSCFIAKWPKEMNKRAAYICRLLAKKIVC